MNVRSTSVAPRSAAPVVAPAHEERPAFNAKALVAFFALTYGLSWGWGLLLASTGNTVLQGRGGPTHFPSLLGPMLAAFAVTAWTMHGPGIHDLLARMVRWRIGWRWWLAALSPIAYLGVALVAVAASGDALPSRADFARFSGLPSGWGVLGVALTIIVINGFGEETGWRGYALPQLQARFSPLTATLILTGFWAGWHVPQFAAVVSTMIMIQAVVLVGSELRASRHGTRSILGPA